MKFNRKLQHEILTELGEAYPNTVSYGGRYKVSDPFHANAHYLAEHDLLVPIKSSTLGGENTVLCAKITAKGLDFLTDDGGLSEILGVVTVKLHADTIRDLLRSGVDASDTPDNEKKLLKDMIKTVPDQALSKLVQECVSYAVRSGGDIVQLIQSACA